MLGLFNKEDANLKRNRKLRDLGNKQQSKYVRPEAEPVRNFQRGAPVLYRGNRYLGTAQFN